MEFHPDFSWKFESMGARIRIGDLKLRRWQSLEDLAPFNLNILSDHRGQYYDLQVNRKKVRRLITLDVRAKQRHLLMFCSERFRDKNGKWLERDHRVLCGHDEREWFCAEIPEQKRVTTVFQAMDALMPNIVRNSLVRRKVKSGDRLKRKNAGYKRQGEWFFIPDPNFTPRDDVYHRNEPLMRGVGKPHMAELLVRHGGKVGYGNGRQNGPFISDAEYRSRMLADPSGTKFIGWVRMVQDPIVHVKGWIRHPDHKTVVLQGWHRVEPNTEETSAGSGQRITFID